MYFALWLNGLWYKSVPVRELHCVFSGEKDSYANLEEYLRRAIWGRKRRVKGYFLLANEPSDWAVWEGFMKTKAQLSQGWLGGAREMSEMDEEQVDRADSTGALRKCLSVYDKH